jgi:hypothetical protein
MKGILEIYRPMELRSPITLHRPPRYIHWFRLAAVMTFVPTIITGIHSGDRIVSSVLLLLLALIVSLSWKLPLSFLPRLSQDELNKLLIDCAKDMRIDVMNIDISYLDTDASLILELSQPDFLGRITKDAALCIGNQAKHTDMTRSFESALRRRISPIKLAATCDLVKSKEAFIWLDPPTMHEKIEAIHHGPHPHA